MDLSQLTSEQFERIVALLKEKDQLDARRAEVIGELREIQGMPSAGRARGDGRARGRLREEIEAALREAGAAGLRVAELARRLNRPNASVHVWFTKAKEDPHIEKLGRGHYRWKEAAPEPG
jgi:hypothetical protein